MRKKLILVILILALVFVNLCVPAFAAIDTSSAPSDLITVDSVALGGISLGVEIPSGTAYLFNGTFLSSLPPFSDYDADVDTNYPYQMIRKYYNDSGELAGYYYYCFNSNSPHRLVDGVLKRYLNVGYCYLYYWESLDQWNPGSFYANSRYTPDGFPLSDVVWTNFDLIDAFDGSLLLPASVDPVEADVYETITFPASSFTQFSTVANVLQYLETSGVSGSGAVDGDVTISYSISDPYVDFVWDKGSENLTYDGLRVNGTFLMKYMLGLRLLGNVNNGSVYYKTDLYPGSYEVLVNGSPVGDRVEIDDVLVPSAGWLQAASDGVGMAPYADSDTEISFSSAEYSFDRTAVETVGLRIYFDTPLGLSDASMSAGTFSTDNIGAYGLFSFYLYQKPTFILTGVKLTDPDPEETDTTDPDPDPTTTTDPDPDPTTTTDPDPDPTTTTDPDPDPTTTTDPDPDPTTTTDPDPEPTDTTVPDPEPEPSFDATQMGGLAVTITGAVDLLKLEITLFGFTFSLWQMLLFDLAASIIIWFVWRFLL